MSTTTAPQRPTLELRPATSVCQHCGCDPGRHAYRTARWTVCLDCRGAHARWLEATGTGQQERFSSFTFHAGAAAIALTLILLGHFSKVVSLYGLALWLGGFLGVFARWRTGGLGSRRAQIGAFLATPPATILLLAYFFSNTEKFGDSSFLAPLTFTATLPLFLLGKEPLVGGLSLLLVLAGSLLAWVWARPHPDCLRGPRLMPYDASDA